MGYLGHNGLVTLKCLHKLLRIFNKGIHLTNIQEEKKNETHSEDTTHYLELCRTKYSILILQRY